MYELSKDLHNLLRWIVILAALWALVAHWGGFLGGRAWNRKDRLSGLVFTSSLNLQLLLGLVVLFLGPVHAAYASMGTTMKDPVLRFFAIEHPFLMVLAVVVAQVGFSLAKRAATDRARFLRGAVCYTIAGVLLAAGIPWPFREAGRPLLPGFLG